MRRLLYSFLAILVTTAPLAHAEMPITTDSRIKTFVYNPNEVFSITTHYGYQSNVEFGERESIDTVSIGDRVAWQIIPAGRRLFIRAMEENAHTNMTIVTNQRAYQFDLKSSGSDATFGSEQLTYVVRFYYPGDPVSATNFMPSPAPMAATPVSYSAPAQAPYTPPVSTGSIPAPAPSYTPAPAPTANAAFNYRYTYSGPSTAAPVKIYDDGRSTYFKYRSQVTPRVSVITARGEQMDVPVRQVGGGVVAVDIVAPRFSLNQTGGQVIVYNEANG